jgi:BirA family biotin operon repressor/biotin-[acetyl-CoA-carboxylase] ligase
VTERPTTHWEGLEGAELADRWGAPQVRLYESVGSSNDVARRLAQSGAPAGTVVLADEQVAGRGRAGRAWASAGGLGLWFSIVSRPERATDAGSLPLLVGVAAASALDEFLPGSGVGIKWPNDLMVTERKLGGILCEASWEGQRAGPMVTGVGVNLLHDADSFPPEIRAGATSLRMEAPGPISRLEVADLLVPAVLRALGADARLDEPALAQLAERDVLRGHRVVAADAMSGNPIVSGVASGILPDGALLVRDAAGHEHRIRSGTVRRLG